MDISEIERTIKQLEGGDTTFESCRKLATLYVVRDNLTTDNVEKELNDILPCYRRYIQIKRDYQTGRATDDLLVNSMESVCKEITEFIETLYNNTELFKERLKIEKTIKELSEKYNPD